jgi:hypothetical protein
MWQGWTIFGVLQDRTLSWVFGRDDLQQPYYRKRCKLLPGPIQWKGGDGINSLPSSAIESKRVKDLLFFHPVHLLSLASN